LKSLNTRRRNGWRGSDSASVARRWFVVGLGALGVGCWRGSSVAWRRAGRGSCARGGAGLGACLRAAAAGRAAAEWLGCGGCALAHAIEREPRGWREMRGERDRGEKRERVGERDEHRRQRRLLKCQARLGFGYWAPSGPVR
jgi:hypothetical protein